jgi:hypothetical protein
MLEKGQMGFNLVFKGIRQQTEDVKKLVSLGLRDGVGEESNLPN